MCQIKLGKELLLISVAVLLLFTQCTSTANKKTAKDDISAVGLKMAVKMADSEMTFFPNVTYVDFNVKPKWNYTPGLISYAMVELSEVTKDKKYFDYAKGYADEFINEDGDIKGYKRSDFNIDKINSGKFLFDLYAATKDEKYKKAIYVLRDQLKDHPRTTEGGFWHKKRYLNQMWLDGLYMGAPFYAEFCKVFNEPESFSDVINQFKTVHKHTYDSITGLNYHGWDESKEQRWANPETGCSPHFWGRAEGWYAMALVDVLDFVPANYPERDVLITILNEVAAAIKKYQDQESGVWYQVLDQGNREGNYLEASASSMFVYTLLKAVRNGYIDKSYKDLAVKGYEGILKSFVRENEDGTISLTKICAVAGLGGNPYREGTYEYYIGEPVRDNDPKGVGPFILASIELTK
ncbi:glycoside hydrolase family 88/105 protein [Plebeiibacterium sediminum]|uniref:Glycoside hydrolase family 88 protein n=1 Tax=Plebeiibacterium sediminum TaxID=2992112 RepID=A0AAE3M1P6_9BACT|nr:glycoside hydrolase family 88 protein [Plebeiobacterium sediminum]MCW3785587.1 glycoside hydrolase family 88 protein [Plebeiobacterium sediminum]